MPKLHRLSVCVSHYYCSLIRLLLHHFDDFISREFPCWAITFSGLSYCQLCSHPWQAEEQFYFNLCNMTKYPLKRTKCTSGQHLLGHKKPERAAPVKALKGCLFLLELYLNVQTSHWAICLLMYSWISGSRRENMQTPLGQDGRTGQVCRNLKASISC